MGRELKQLYLNIGEKHLYIFLIGIIFVSFLMNLYPTFFGLDTFQFVGCTDGTLEEVIINKTIYCGQNISELGFTIVNGKFIK